jgi:menaquinol-cytochrome c reductase iron-sulfur subunit
MSQSTPARSQDVSRRGFVGWAFGVGAGFVALVAGIPLIGSVVASGRGASPAAFVSVATVAGIPTGEPFGITFVEQTRDAYLYSMLPHSIYALKSSDSEVIVYSPVCPHLGCQVFFDRQKQEYICPCHGSIFAMNGARVSGPSPRGLDILPSKIEGGELLVQWVQYKSGVPDKTPV